MVIVAEIEYQPQFVDPVFETQIQRLYGISYDILDENIRVIEWVEGTDFDGFERVLREIASVREYRALATQDDRALYSIIFGLSPEESVYYTAAQQDFQLLESEITENGAYLRCRIPSRDALRIILDEFETQGYEVSLRRLYQPTDLASDGTTLTERQREVLSLAFERGYFEYPHGTTIEQLATELDITDTAVSKHLWRGLSKLVADWIN